MTSGSTVYRTKRRFVEGNLELALAEAPRAGAERKLTGNLARADYWLTHGAQLSDRVAKLMKQARGSEAS